MKITWPTVLTLARLIISPVALPVLIVYLLPSNVAAINYTLAALFFVFSLTDMLDGYLARRFGEVTKLGALLDPLADKFLVSSTLIALLAAQKIFFVWVLIIIGRELFIMGLRLVALEHAIHVAVSGLGKLKTMAQSLYLTVLIANPYHAYALVDSRFNQFEILFLGITLLFSCWSAYRYYRSVIALLSVQRDVASH